MRNLITVGLLVKKTRVKNSQRGTAGTIRRNSVTVIKGVDEKNEIDEQQWGNNVEEKRQL